MERSYSFVCVCACLFLVIIQFGSAEACTALNGGPGKCITLEACEPYLEAMRVRGDVSNPITTWMLRKAHCGFQGNAIKVCCPVEETKELKENLVIEAITTSTLPPSTLPPSTLPPSTLPPSTLPPSTLPPSTSTTSTTESTTINYDLLSMFGDTCKTVYNTTGSCKDLYLCETMMEVAKRAARSPEDAKLLKQAHCGFRGEIPKVCCPLPFQPTELPPTTTTTEATTTTTSAPTTVPRRGGDFLTALPEAPACGVSNVAPRDRVVSGIPAKLGAFPWMALLGYKDLSIAAGMRWRCGGSLLSVRHVLTAAHCIHYQEDDLFVVRLGELDLDRDDEGATPADFLIKEKIKHEQYTKNAPFAHDVGILVLERDVEFTDLIKPICLPSKQWLSNTFENFSPFVAGWGNLKFGGIAASHLQVAQVPVINNADCERAYSAYLTDKSRVHFSTRTLCAGYMQGGIDSCDGDSGGPLMQTLHDGNYKTYFYVIGVVSVGRKCAQANAPGVYARVTHYMPWIQEKLLGSNS